MHAGIVQPSRLPAEIAEVCGRTRRQQLRTFVRAVIRTDRRQGEVGHAAGGGRRARRRCGPSTTSGSTSDRRRWPSPARWSRCCGPWWSTTPSTRRCWPRLRRSSPASSDPVRAAVAYVAGMTDRYAFDRSIELLGWNPARLPQGVDAAG